MGSREEVLCRSLVRRLVGEVDGNVQKKYVVENLLSVLVPGLIELLRVRERGEEGFMPLTFLASYLYRHNPLHNAKLARKQLEFREMVFEERQRLRHENYIERLTAHTMDELKKLEFWWPLDRETGEMTAFLPLRSNVLLSLLEELRNRTGMKNLKEDMLLYFEILDVKNEKRVEFHDFATILASVLRANNLREIRIWLQGEISRRLREIIQNYLQDDEGPEFEEREDMLDFISEILANAFEWKFRERLDHFDPEVVVDSVEAAGKGSLVPELINDLTRTRLKTFSL